MAVMASSGRALVNPGIFMNKESKGDPWVYQITADGALRVRSMDPSDTKGWRDIAEDSQMYDDILAATDPRDGFLGRVTSIAEIDSRMASFKKPQSEKPARDEIESMLSTEDADMELAQVDGRASDVVRRDTDRLAYAESRGEERRQQEARTKVGQEVNEATKGMNDALQRQMDSSTAGIAFANPGKEAKAEPAKGYTERLSGAVDSAMSHGGQFAQNVGRAGKMASDGLSTVRKAGGLIGAGAAMPMAALAGIAGGTAINDAPEVLGRAKEGAKTLVSSARKLADQTEAALLDELERRRAAKGSK